MAQMIDDVHQKLMLGEVFIHDIINTLDLRGKLALDIGANYGHYARYLADAGAKVVAFEPDADNFQGMLDKDEGGGNITYEKMAVGNVNGPVPFYLCPLNPGAHSIDGTLLNYDWGHSKEHIIQVPCVRLDDYFSPETNISFMKIDVEGAEEGVLRGAENLLRKTNPKSIALETHRTINCDSIYRFMSSMGYYFYIKRNSDDRKSYIAQVDRIYTDCHYLITNVPR